jgi:polyhydroxyalkanoate synthesis regulator phasin
VTSQDLQKRSELKRKLQDLYQELIEEGVLEDMELYHIDPIRMVSGEMAQFIRMLTGDPTIDAPKSEQDKNEEAAVFASTLLAAAESLAQDDMERNRRLEEIKAPLQRSVNLLTRIIEDDEAVQVSKEALRQNVEILRQCLARLEEGL